MKNYYELLSVAVDADAEDIKRSFRREIARYHPDKVSHLGPEFLQIAESRAAELTEAYRILMDPLARATYDEQLSEGSTEPTAPPAPATPAAAAAEPRANTPPPPVSFREERATRDQFVRKAALTRFQQAVTAALGSVTSSPSRGFDASFTSCGRRGLFGKSEAAHVLARFVPMVDAAAIGEAWSLASKVAGPSAPHVFLMGSGLAPAAELAGTIADLRRKSRGNAPVLVPVDVRDWDALVPTEAPPAVRTIIDKLKKP